MTGGDDDLADWTSGERRRELCVIVPLTEVELHILLGYELESETSDGALMRPPKPQEAAA